MGVLLPDKVANYTYWLVATWTRTRTLATL